MTDRDHSLEECLSRFGLTAFRPGQREVIDAVLQGRDALCIMPTGGGKSLCYQLPSVLRPGTTLVVSPLIALMKDQVDSLRSRSMRASFINSSLLGSEQHDRLQRLMQGEFDLLYVAPERFRSRRFLEALRRVSITLLAIDEAHCISEWGHDFRHDYARLGEYRRRIGNPQTMALTATATQDVRDDIVQQLGLHQPATLVAGFSRPNLRLSVHPCHDSSEKQGALSRFLRRVTGSGIIYAATRRACESIAADVEELAGRPTVVYHGGMEPEARRRTQEQFMAQDAVIAVATNAFGMGIDKANVRFVVHYNFPGSVEAYYQEAGRAGRDGENAECLLLYQASDRAIHRFFIESAYPDPDVVRQVYDFLANHPNDPVEMTQQQIKDALRLKISQEGIGTCERLLEKAGAVERLEPNRNMAIVRIHTEMPTLVDLLPKQATSQRQVLRLAEAVVDDRRGEDVFFAPAEWSERLGVTLTVLGRTLRDLRRLELFDYVPAFRGRAARVLRPDVRFHELQLDFEQLMARKEADYRKLRRMVQFMHTSACRQLYILEYFGDPTASACGTCDQCHPQDAPPCAAGSLVPGQVQVCVPLREAPRVHEAIRIVLSGVARAEHRVGKNLIVGMLAGSQATKISKNRLNQLSTFGLLSHLKQAEISELVDQCLNQDWIEQVEIERFRPVTRLTSGGQDVMRSEVPPAVKFSVSASTARKLGYRSSWRRDEASATPAGAVNHCRPHTTAQVSIAAAHRPSDEQLPASHDSYWTGRLLETGFSLDECAQIRRLPRTEIVAHATALVSSGMKFDPQRLFSTAELLQLRQFGHAGMAPNGATANSAAGDRQISPEVLLLQQLSAVDQPAGQPPGQP